MITEIPKNTTPEEIAALLAKKRQLRKAYASFWANYSGD
jgi:hypothetical protein